MAHAVGHKWSELRILDHMTCLQAGVSVWRGLFCSKNPACQLTFCQHEFYYRFKAWIHGSKFGQLSRERMVVMKWQQTGCTEVDLIDFCATNLSCCFLIGVTSNSDHCILKASWCQNTKAQQGAFLHPHQVCMDRESAPSLNFFLIMYGLPIDNLVCILLQLSLKVINTHNVLACLAWQIKFGTAGGSLEIKSTTSQLIGAATGCQCFVHYWIIYFLVKMF